MMNEFLNNVKNFFDELVECFIEPDIEEFYFKNKIGNRSTPFRYRVKNSHNFINDDIGSSPVPGLYFSNVPDFVIEKRRRRRKRRNVDGNNGNEKELTLTTNSSPSCSPAPNINEMIPLVNWTKKEQIMIDNEKKNEDGNNLCCNDSYEKCPICIVELEDGDLVKILPSCSHVYHGECVDQWLKVNNSCPLCKREVGLLRGGEGGAISITVK